MRMRHWVSRRGRHTSHMKEIGGRTEPLPRATSTASDPLGMYTVSLPRVSQNITSKLRPQLRLKNSPVSQFSSLPADLTISNLLR
jgi:hypothetical protein